ncbi:MAG: SGNH/GDSL hydrolase family protein [Planctomycetota bacterium]
MPTKLRVLVALVSTVLALAIGWALLPERESRDTGIVDDRASFSDFLTDRASESDALTQEFELVVETMPEEHAYKLFAGLKSDDTEYDPEVYYRHKPNLSYPREFPEHPGGKWTLRTNASGFRDDDETLTDKPDLRVLVIGDSHTDGACDNRFTAANVLEELLRERSPDRTVEVVNAGVGSYSFYNYLGGIEKFKRELDVDVYVCMVFGGNDFLGTLRPTHYFQRTLLPVSGKPYYKRIDRFRKVARHPDRNLGQAVFQLSFLTEFPEQAEIAMHATELLTSAMAERARELELPLVFAYIPPAWDIQLERYEPRAADFAKALMLDESGVVGADGWADRWIAHVRSLGLPIFDPRDEWREADVDLYWLGDHHINIEGQRRMAEGLLPLVEAAAL